METQLLELRENEVIVQSIKYTDFVHEFSRRFLKEQREGMGELNEAISRKLAELSYLSPFTC